MPTVLRLGPYGFYFYSHEPGEPPHVHVDRESLPARFWPSPVALARNYGFGASELRRLDETVNERVAFFLEAWYGYLGR